MLTFLDKLPDSSSHVNNSIFMSRRLTGARPIRALCITSLVNIHERRRRRSRIGKLVSLLDVFRSPKPFWTRFSSVHVRIGPWPAILALAREKLHTHERDLCGTRRLFRTGRRFCWNRRFSWWICACVKVWLNPIAGWTSGRRSLGLVCVCVRVHMSVCAYECVCVYPIVLNACKAENTEKEKTRRVFVSLEEYVRSLADFCTSSGNF